MLNSRSKGTNLGISSKNWKAYNLEAIRRMQELETQNNKQFILAYGLENELNPTVDQSQITLTRSGDRQDLASFLSYATGCMMGR